MFIRVKKIGQYEYLYLVQNVREGGRHVQKVISTLGRRDDVENSGLLDGLIASAARHSRRSIVLSRFYRGELAELRRRSIGPDLVFGRLWQETGCAGSLRQHLADRHFGFDVERAVYLTVLHRLMVSGSDRRAASWRETIEVPGADGITLDHAYKAMAWLGEPIAPVTPDDARERYQAEVIEEALYAHRRALFGAAVVAFFDTTSLYFEGRGGATLGQRGHSKDYRPQLNQVVLGIVLDENDRPITSFLWPGNTTDVTTLIPVVERLRSRFGINRACVVADRGMISAATIAQLEAQGIDYILGARERSSKEIRETVLKDDGVSVPLIIPRQKGVTELAVKEVKIAGRRYIVCRNPEEARKDAETRAKLLSALSRKLSQGDKALVGNSGYRRFLVAPDGAGFAIDPAKVEADAAFDGLFVLRTNMKLSPLAVVLRYRQLLSVEQSFLASKTLMATRPVYHRTDAAIRGHIFCTFLALILRHELLARLATRKDPMPEWQQIIDDLADLSVVDVEQDGRRARLRTAPRASIDPVCRAVGLSLPPVFQEMTSSKSREPAT
ncbi:IS1634 family transposase [Acidiphilium acidophilum]|uniref:IS1634 family transposase n=1 Tax=Acidiphilium acidophilum TaxID=76588 RepID=A0AAW9DLY0_ACIAO|nr:IS1634 family transposase [Acidiphilium acidophilum]MDX5929686.1 IS1634 family transposase [Acidiphilium acidophilum]GBR73484.1 putative transposase [Acidiphilium acidophilum DSM 700]